MTEREILSDVWNAMYRGKGTKEDPGLLVRVDRLERFLSIFTWISGTAIGAVLYAVADWAVSMAHR